jgi:hypothetical protein
MGKFAHVGFAILLAASAGVGVGCSSDGGSASKKATTATNKVSGQPQGMSSRMPHTPTLNKGVTNAPQGMSKVPGGMLTRSASAPKKTVNQTVMSNRQSAASLSGHRRLAAADCGALDLAEGEGYCYDDVGTSYVVFCEGGAPYALECDTFSEEGHAGVCGEVDDTIDCVTGPSDHADALIIEEVTFTADAQDYCSPEEEGVADCEGDYLVFCHNEAMHELDCTTYVDAHGEAATCGVITNAVACGFDE